MTRRRLRWIAVQAIVVTALAVVVVLTLLKPESQSPLSGISGSDNSTIAQGPGSGPGGDNPGGNGNGGDNHGQNNPSGPGNGHGDQGGAGGDEDDLPATGTATGSVGGAPPAPVPVAPESSTIRPEGETDPQSPTDDQYSDTLGALDAAVP